MTSKILGKIIPTPLGDFRSLLKMYFEQHTKRQVYKNAKVDNVYHRCLCFIFDQVGPDFPFHFIIKISFTQTVMFQLKMVHRPRYRRDQCFPVMFMSRVLNLFIWDRGPERKRMRSFLPFLCPLNFPLSRENRMPDRRFVDPQLRSSTLIKSSRLLYIFDRF